MCVCVFVAVLGVLQKKQVRDVRSHRLVTIAEGEGPSVVELSVIQPYKKIIQHAGLLAL